MMLQSHASSPSLGRLICHFVPCVSWLPSHHRGFNYSRARCPAGDNDDYGDGGGDAAEPVESGEMEVGRGKVSGGPGSDA